MREKAAAKGRKLEEFASEQLLMNLERDDKLAAIAPGYGYSLGEDFIAVRCKKENHTFTVTLKDNQLYCEDDRKMDCIHVMYALATPEVNKLWLKKPGK